MGEFKFECNHSFRPSTYISLQMWMSIEYDLLMCSSMRFVPVIWDFEWSSKIEQFSLEQQIGPKQHSNTQSSHGSNSIRFVLRFDMSEMCVCVFLGMFTFCIC